MVPKFSIIMCNFNQEKFIEQTIASVLNQTFQDWELVIVDDCSTDNSLSVIEKYKVDKRIRLLRHKKNLGYTAALKTGISNISSDLFGILDSDDVLTPDALESMYSAHIEYPDAGLIYSQFMYCDENLRPTQTGYCKQIPSNKTTLDSDAVSHFKTFKVKFYNQTEGYKEEILHAQDKDISYKMEEVSQLKFIDKVLYHYRVQPNSLQRDTNYRGLEYVMKAKINALQRRNEKNATLQKDALLNFATASDSFYKEDFSSAEAEMDKYRKSIKYDLFPKIDTRKIENPLVSVIVVAYQTNELLLDCLHSFLNQTEKNFEVIVVDNGGNDRVLKQLLTSPLLYIKCPMNFILSEGRNIGAHFAKADIIASLDDDATVPNNYVESIIEAFNTYDIIGFRGKVLAKNTEKYSKLPETYDLGEIPVPSTIVAEGNSAFLRDKYQELKGMNPLLFGGEGLELSMRILLNYGENLTIYWPSTVIFHDPADKTKQDTKQERYKVMLKYLVRLHPHVWEYHNNLMAFAKDDESKKKGQALLRMKKPDSDQNRISGDSRITWDKIKKLSPIRLYAGDIPDMREYDGLIGLSIAKNDERHILHDITKPFPLPDNSVESFQAEDVFEHIPYAQLIPVINEIFRILKPNGLFRLSIPDYGCDVLQNRSIKNPSGQIVFDPGGEGTFLNPGHLWFPRIDTVKRLLEQTDFANHGRIEYLHYYEMDGTFVMKRIDYSKGHVRRTPDFDVRVRNPRRPMSLVVDLIKGSGLSPDGTVVTSRGEIQTEENKQLNLLQVHTFYPHYLSDFYQRDPLISHKSFREQISALVADGFSGSHMLAPYMSELGYTSQLVIANSYPAQLRWLRENGLQLHKPNDWLNEIVQRQINVIKPDILYLSDPITFDSRFVRSLTWKPKLVMGWRAAIIPEGTDWSEFDVILSSLTALRNFALTLGAKATEHFFPGFPVWICDQIKDVTPTYDVVFSGQWTVHQHRQRNKYLQEIANFLKLNNEMFSCAFYLSGKLMQSRQKF